MTEIPYGYCGMPCALCSRNRVNGSSRCPGCSNDGYYTYGCKVYGCCCEKGLRQCGECGGFPCARLGKMGDFSDLNTNNAKLRTCGDVASSGFDAWYGDYRVKAEMLTEALERYNDGRMKRYLCELFIQNELPVLREIMSRASDLSGTKKEIGAAFRQTADSALREKQNNESIE